MVSFRMNPPAGGVMRNLKILNELINKISICSFFTLLMIADTQLKEYPLKFCIFDIDYFYNR